MRTRTRTTFAAGVAVVAVFVLSPVADADKDDSIPTRSDVAAAESAVARRSGDVAAIRAELAVAQNKLQHAAEQAERAAEAYNGARWQLQQATARAAAAAAAATAASRNVDSQRDEIATLAVQSFQAGAELTGVTAYLSPGGPQDIADQIAVTRSVGATLDSRYQEFAAAEILAKDARAEAEAAKRDQAASTAKAAQTRDQAAASATAAQAAAAAIASERRQLIAELASAQQISVALATRRQAGLERIAQAKAAQARAEAAAQAAAAAAAAEKADKPDKPASGAGNGNGNGSGSGSGGSSSGSTNDNDSGSSGSGGNNDTPSDPPPTSSTSAGARAVQFAKAQLGERYQWAAAGPNSWDCSGLTMMAWREGGVSLPHYSAAQYQQTQRIGVNDLRAGDLVFWGDSPGSIHHVAMYIGNGQIIHAPRTGRPVSIDSMYYWVPPNYFGRP